VRWPFSGEVRCLPAITPSRDGHRVELIVDHWSVVMFEGAIRKYLKDDMFTDADRAMLKRAYDHLEASEPLTWTKRLRRWSGPDVETGQAFVARTASRH